MTFSLDSLDLAALLCSRVCHDVISPVGAIINGLEVLDEEQDGDMRGYALDLIKKSAQTASARLQFCRLAFGAAGSAGASIDTGDAEQVVKGLLGEGRTSLHWNAQRVLMPKNKVKLLLNLCLIGSAAIPRGGVIDVNISGDSDAPQMRIEARGPHAKVASHVAHLVAGVPEGDTVDAHGIQAFYTGLVARAATMDVTIETEPERVILMAKPTASAIAVEPTNVAPLH